MAAYKITISPVHNRALPPTVLFCASYGKTLVALANIARSITSTYDTGLDGVLLVPTEVDGETQLAIPGKDGVQTTVLTIYIEEVTEEESHNCEPA